MSSLYLEGKGEAAEDRPLPARQGADSMDGAQAVIGAGAGVALASMQFGQLVNAPSPADREGDIDGCDVDVDVANQTTA